MTYSEKFWPYIALYTAIFAIFVTDFFAPYKQFPDRFRWNDTLEVGLELRTRGAVVLHKVLTARDAEEGGELRQFLSSLAQEQSGNEFLLTWARAFDWGVQVSM